MRKTPIEPDAKGTAKLMGIQNRGRWLIT